MKFTRNSGFINQKEQSILHSSRAAIAGTGGDGGQLALTLARMGFGSFTLADPEKFEIENTNRQAGCYTSTLGRNKAEVIAEIIKDINPEAEITLLNEGVTESNINEFLENADVVVDETEFTQHGIGVLIARGAREKGVRVFMGLNVGFGCIVTSFDPKGLTFEQYLGLNESDSLEEVNRQIVPLEKWVSILPDYISLETVEAVASGKISAPSVAPGVDICAGVLASEVFNGLTGRNTPIEAPETYWFDAMERRSLRITNREKEFADSIERISKRI